MILILGSEGEGVSRTIARMADERVIIPPRGETSKIGIYPFNMIDSLNVGVTAALMLHQINVLLKK